MIQCIIISGNDARADFRVPLIAPYGFPLVRAHIPVMEKYIADSIRSALGTALRRGQL